MLGTQNKEILASEAYFKYKGQSLMINQNQEHNP